MKKLIVVGLLFLISCSSSSLADLSINCLCEAAQHFVASNNEDDEGYAEFSFTNSRVLDLGVSEESLALSSAILIEDKFDLESNTIIKISLISEKGTRTETKSISYTQEEIQGLSADYFEIEVLINEFIKNMYENNFSQCWEVTKIDIEYEEFNKIMKQIRQQFEMGLINARIVGYSVGESGFFIYGGIWTENEVLDLFSMNFAETDSGLRIIGFEF